MKKKILVTRKLLKSNEERILKLWNAHLNLNDEVYSSKKLIELSVVLKQQVLQIIVEDFGSGIPKNKLKEITKPLYRGRVAKEQSKSGFGLGLAITKKIVEAHSGQLIIESEVGCGTKFIVSLPINRK